MTRLEPIKGYQVYRNNQGMIEFWKSKSKEIERVVTNATDVKDALRYITRKRKKLTTAEPTQLVIE